jgi:hypothetical protein
MDRNGTAYNRTSSVQHSYLPVFSAIFSIFSHFQHFQPFLHSHFQQLPCLSGSDQTDLPQNFLTDNSTCRSLKLILKRSALSPLSAHLYVTLTLFLMISRKLKMAETAENG